MMWRVECAEFELDSLDLCEKVWIGLVEMIVLGWDGLLACVVKGHVYVLDDFIDSSQFVIGLYLRLIVRRGHFSWVELGQKGVEVMITKEIIDKLVGNVHRLKCIKG